MYWVLTFGVYASRTLGSDKYNEFVTQGFISEDLFNIEELGHEVTQFENTP
jgi:hypothetical protein